MAFDNLAGVRAGSTSNSVYLYVRNATTGVPLTGKIFSDFTLGYLRGQTAATAITAVTQTAAGAWTAGGVCEVSATLCPGLYRLDAPDAAFAAGVSQVAFGGTVAGGIIDPITVLVSPYVGQSADAGAQTTAAKLRSSARIVGAVVATVTAQDAAAGTISGTITAAAGETLPTTIGKGSYLYFRDPTTGNCVGVAVLSGNSTGGSFSASSFSQAGRAIAVSDTIDLLAVPVEPAAGTATIDYVALRADLEANAAFVAKINRVNTDYTTPRAVKIDALDANVSTRSTHTAADVKTALEATGSALDTARAQATSAATTSTSNASALTALSTKLGTPVGADVVTDITSTRTQATTAATQATTAATQATTAATQATSAATQATSAATTSTSNASALTALSTKLGTPATASVAGDIAAVLTQATTAATGAGSITNAAARTIADAILGRTIAGGADGGRTVRQALASQRNKVASNTAKTQFIVYAEDDTTPLYAFDITRVTTEKGVAGLAPAVTVVP